MQDVFVFAALVSIAAGGTLSAFRAKAPSRQAMWVSAYLVLITGLFQLGLALGLPSIVENFGVVVAGLLMALYNIGSVGVIVGTLYKQRTGWRSFSVAGSLLITGVVLVAGVGAYGQRLNLQAGLFYVTVVVLFITSLVGAKLAARK